MRGGARAAGAAHARDADRGQRRDARRRRRSQPSRTRRSRQPRGPAGAPRRRSASGCQRRLSLRDAEPTLETSQDDRAVARRRCGAARRSRGRSAGARWGRCCCSPRVVLPSIYLLHRGAPYADAKVLMIVSPAILLLAMLGATSLWTGRWRALSARRDGRAGRRRSRGRARSPTTTCRWRRTTATRRCCRLDDRLAGRGPALFSEYDEFAEVLPARRAGLQRARVPDHVFRDAPYKPNALRDRRRRPSEKTPIDIDDLTLRLHRVGART